MDERTANQRTELLTAINGLDAAVSVTSLLRILNVSHVDHAAVVTTAQALHAEGLIGRIPVAPPTGSYFAYFPLHLLSDALPASLPQNLTTEQALAVLERAGWKPEPEVVTIEERSVADRRARRARAPAVPPVAHHRGDRRRAQPQADPRRRRPGDPHDPRARTGCRMSVCDTCRQPGACCTSFTLNFTVPKATWRESSLDRLAPHGIDYFEPVRPLLDLDSRDSTAVVFRCTRLGADGRCTDYENRPELCHLYQPQEDAMCVEFVRSFHGIPVVTVTA